jgi:hypothetical protein
LVTANIVLEFIGSLENDRHVLRSSFRKSDSPRRPVGTVGLKSFRFKIDFSRAGSLGIVQVLLKTGIVAH